MGDMRFDDDVRLMIAAKGGDDDAFSQLLDAYAPRIINFIYRYTGSRADADDLAQEVFLRVYRAKETYEPKAKFSTWIYRIATNVCLDNRKKDKSDVLRYAAPEFCRTDEGDNTEIEPANPADKRIEEMLELENADAAVRTALASLPGNQRLALTLKVYEDRSYEEIASIVNCSVSAVESLIFRARQSLKQKLQGV
jgi:RNA polymerase sigma-70 factor (ECF subfamily)